MSFSLMSQRLSDKTILITGASSGIGKSTAFEFARTSPQSLHLILTARRLEALQAIANEIVNEVGNGVKIFVYQLDVSKADEIDRFVASLPEEFKKVDVLVNNAGLAKGGMSQSPNLSREDISEMFATNVTGLINMTQAILPIMLANPGGGRGDIINLNSIAGREPYIGGSIYCATKSAVASYSSASRRELVMKGSKIRVMEIAPGQVETEFSVVRFGGDKAAADKVYAGCEPLTPDDIAEIIVFAVGRRENVVVADTLVFPNHQASATVLHRKG